jgi:5S rRNA maturation endonuclease (ribonuclease M5)
VVAAVKMKMSDLMPSKGHANGNGQPSKIVATYDYRDENNVLLYQAVRYEPKDFRQRSPKPGGGWNWSTKGVRRVLYRLPELLAADPTTIVFIDEGEKDVDRLRTMGLVATCNVGGASKSDEKTKWLKEYNDSLRGRHVVILVDNDEAGRAHALSIAKSLRGIAASVKLLYLPGLPDKGDVSDWLNSGGTKEELLALAEMTPEYGVREPGDEPDEPFPGEPSSQYDEPPRGTAEEATAHRQPVQFQRITAAELDAGSYELEYLIEGTMTAGQPLILAGGKKNLKTNVLLDASISIASGTPFLGKLTVNRQAVVGVMTGESGLATIQETCRRICRARGLKLADIDGLIISPDIPRAELSDHLEALEKFIRHDGIEILAIDPAYMSLPGDDAGNLFKQGTMLRELAAVCTRAGATLILAHHTKKNIADPFKPPELEDIAWSGFQEFARQWWMLARREPYQPGTGDHKLWLSVGGSAGHSALWALNIAEGVYDGHTPRVWGVEMLSANDAREGAKKEQAEQRADKAKAKWQVAVEECKEAIEQAYVGIPGHIEIKRTIEERSGRKGKAFDEAFAYLLRTGRIKEAKLTRANKQEYDAFQFKFEGAKE